MSVPHAKNLPNAFTSETAQRALHLARETLQIEADAILALKNRLSTGGADSCAGAVDLLCHCPGRGVVSGIGKSGHIARKIAATLASTGTPALFVHPGEASHGDLGMIVPDEAVIALSNSGETAELTDLVAYTRRFSIPLIAVTSNAASPLGEAAQI